MISARLLAYLDLERAMLGLDELDDPLADNLRDAMDPLWFGLSDEERAMLNRRDLQRPALRGASLAKVVQSRGADTHYAVPFQTLVHPRTTSGSTLHVDVRAA